jgi:heme A synthase
LAERMVMRSSGVWLRRLVAAGVALAFAVVVLGAYTRLMDAGLGCPDWPGCYGYLSVPSAAANVDTKPGQKWSTDTSRARWGC